MKLRGWITVVLVLVSLQLFTGCGEEVPDFPVKYRVTFTPLWTVNTHPVNYPQDAAFSPFITYSHKPNSDLFTVGLIAQDGVQNLAETGNLSRIEEEIDLLRSSDRALDRASGDEVTYPRTSEVILGFDEAHTMASVLAKISPSPDWFVAATNVQLYVNGAWVDSIGVATMAYDGGTDMGNNFDASDQPNNPPGIISIINTSPLAENGTVRTLAVVGFKKVK